MIRHADISSVPLAGIQLLRELQKSFLLAPALSVAAVHGDADEPVRAEKVHCAAYRGKRGFRSSRDLFVAARKIAQVEDDSLDRSRTPVISASQKPGHFLMTQLPQDDSALRDAFAVAIGFEELRGRADRILLHIESVELRRSHFSQSQGVVTVAAGSVDDKTAREALRLAINKLPIKCKIVTRESEEEA